MVVLLSVALPTQEGALPVEQEEMDVSILIEWPDGEIVPPVFQ
ncbi:hypothetical protein C100_10095 [Sphingobium sp. C100]|nr:hypothetical protein C100_10095 [Sphingobium sp. C100]